MKIYFGIFGLCLIFLFIYLLRSFRKKRARTDSGPCPSRTRPAGPFKRRGPTTPPAPPPETLAVVILLARRDPLGWWWRYGYGAAHHGREPEAEDPRRCLEGFRLFSCSGSFPISIFSPPSESLIDAIESIDKDMLRCAISRIHPSTWVCCMFFY